MTSFSWESSASEGIKRDLVLHVAAAGVEMHRTALRAGVVQRTMSVARVRLLGRGEDNLEVDVRLLAAEVADGERREHVVAGTGGVVVRHNQVPSKSTPMM